MRNDHKLNVWPTPPGRAPGASVAPASCLDDRRNNDNSEPGHAFRVHAENGWVVVELPGYPPFPEDARRAYSGNSCTASLTPGPYSYSLTWAASTTLPVSS